MKKIVKITSLLLVLTLCLFAMACSSYGKLERAFEKEGYTVSETMKGIMEDYQNSLKEEGEETPITVHALSKGITVVIIFEFKATDDLKEKYADSATMQGVVEDIKNSEDANAIYDKLVEEGYVNGNCFVFTTNPFAVDAVKNIVKNA